MSRQYPFYDGWERNRAWQAAPEKAPKCTGCDKPAQGVCTWQTSWFRSDDCTYRVCDRKAHTFAELLAAALPTPKEPG